MLDVVSNQKDEKNVISFFHFHEEVYRNTMLSIIKKLFNGLGQKVDLQEIASKGAIIIDVRNPGEFSAGNVPGTRNIPLGNISSKIEQIRNYNKPIITCCVSGTRSGIAKTMLKAKGIEAYNGGRWQNMQALIEAKPKEKH